VSTSPRKETQLVVAAAQWCKEARAHFGWSEADLVQQCIDVQYPFRFGEPPTEQDVTDLESGSLKHLPRWLRYARFAVEKASLSPELRAQWPGERTWFTYSYEGGDPFDCSYPLVFRDEFYLLEALSSLPGDRFRATKRFVMAMASPYISTHDAAARLLSDFDVKLEQAPEVDGQSQLSKLYAELNKGQRAQLLDVAEKPKLLNALTAYAFAEKEGDINGMKRALSRIDESGLIKEADASKEAMNGYVVEAMDRLSPEQRLVVLKVVGALSHVDDDNVRREA
jgi:hypothetical protein